MRNRPSKKFTLLPYSKLIKDTSTPLGKYIIYTVVFCSILTALLGKLFSHLIASEEIAVGLTVGIVLILLIVLMWKMRSIVDLIDRKRMERFKRRLERTSSDKEH